jgi:hypothetical protein
MPGAGGWWHTGGWWHWWLVALVAGGTESDWWGERGKPATGVFGGGGVLGAG